MPPKTRRRVPPGVSGHASVFTGSRAVIAHFHISLLSTMNSPQLSTMNFIRTFLIAAALTLLAAAPPAWAETAGTLDPDFNPNVSGEKAVVRSMAVQPDGKIIIGGNFTKVQGASHANVARLNADGSVDPTFTASTNYYVDSVAVQADGKIVLGGQFDKVNDTGRSYLARLTEDGKLDASFTAVTNANVTSVAVQADKQLVLGGQFSTVKGTSRNGIARIKEDGSLDEIFKPEIGAGSYVFSVGLQAGEMVVLSGELTISGKKSHGIARLNAQGGLVTSNIANNYVYSVAVQADGKIVLGGAFGMIDDKQRVRIARLNADGTLEDTVTFNPGSGANATVNSVAVQTNEKIVLGGQFTSVNNQPRNRIARLNSNGNVEDTATFNPGSGANNNVVGVAVQTDGKIVLSGDFTAVNATVRNAIARLDNDGATQPVTVPDLSQVLWTRSGAEPEVSQVTFDLSTDRRSTWTPLPGHVTRIPATSNWQLTGLSLPTSGEIRARGFMSSGYESGSSGITQKEATFGALEMLIAGNARFAGGHAIHPDQSAAKREELAGGQAPFAIVVGCADSRVPPEIVFDQGLGDIFIVRVAGEVVDAFGLGTIEYGVEHLDSALIVVLGHEECGAVKAAVNNDPVHGNIKILVDAVKANIGDTKPLEEAVKKNARKVAELIKLDLTNQHLFKEKKVKIVTGYYNLHTGIVTYFE
jgi:uncharacterized delta-60 repeat protein